MRRLLIAVFCLLAIGAAIMLVPEANWRVRVIALKLQGALDDLNWGELLWMLNPRSPYYLEPILTTKSPYLTIHNPYTAEADLALGAKIFRARCAACHGADGTGGSGPDLAGGSLRQGSSDWALFRTIAGGVPGTAMPAHDLPDHEIWATVAFVRSLRQSFAPPLDREAGADSGGTPASPEVTYERLLRAAESGDWLTFSGTYDGRRYSRLDQIGRDNVGDLKLQWVFQLPTDPQHVETTPLVAANAMYLTGPMNEVWALDARSGRPFWSYKRDLPEQLPGWMLNRGLAILGNKLYMGTLDAHLMALDAVTGAVVWDVSVADHRAGYGITGAPLAIEDSIVTGVAGGEYGIQGFIAAYDADTGQLRWKFNTIPGPGEPGHHTWEGDSWKNGGAATWMTGSFDPELDSLYWGVGNPSPTYDGAMREGDNLYANSVVALDPKTGRRKWHFQFTPHDEHDWDAVQVPILIESQQGLGAPRKLMLWANKNGFYYVLDRESGKMLLARALVRQNWAEAIDPNGRPILNPNMSPSPRGTLTYPGEMGATNWWPPAYSPLAHLLYVLTLDSGSLFFRNEEPFRKGEMFNRGTSQPAPGEAHRFAIQAVVPETGELKWEYRLSPRQPKRSHYMGGLLSTAGGLIFGSDGAWFLALDAHTGEELWRFNAGGDIAAAPITYMVDRRQHVAVAAGRAILTFSLDRE